MLIIYQHNAMGMQNVEECHITLEHRNISEKKKLVIVSGRGHTAAMTSPIGVNEITRLRQQFVGMSAEVVPLSLKN